MNINELCELVKEIFTEKEEYLVWIGDINYIYIRKDGFIRLEIKQHFGLLYLKIVDEDSKTFTIPTKNRKEFLCLFKEIYENYDLHKSNFKLAKDNFKNLSDDGVIRYMRDRKLNEIL